MQKLQAKSKNVPRNASLVPCSTTFPLNRVEKPSVAEKLLTCNNLEVNHRVSCSRIELESFYGKNSTISGKGKKVEQRRKESRNSSQG